MKPETQAFLAGCDDASTSDICPTQSVEQFKGFMGRMRVAVNRAIALRMEFIEMAASETDPAVRGRIEELDQKLGAIEREARKAMDQNKKLHDLLQEFKLGQARVRADIEVIQAERAAAEADG